MENKQASFSADELSAEWSLLLANYLQNTIALRKENESLAARIHELEIELVELRPSIEAEAQ